MGLPATPKINQLLTERSPGSPRSPGIARDRETCDTQALSSSQPFDTFTTKPDYGDHVRSRRFRRSSEISSNYHQPVLDLPIQAQGLCHPMFMSDDALESSDRLTCPSCGEPFPIARMNLCFIARYECPHCGASILIEGDKVTAETPSRES